MKIHALVLTSLHRAITSTFGWDYRKAVERYAICLLRKWYHPRKEGIFLDSSQAAFPTAFI